MKVLMINGSPHKEGSTYIGLTEVAKALDAEGVDHELIWLGNGPVRDCIGCHGCRTSAKKCVFDDDMVNEIIDKIKDADGVIFGTPVYYAHPSGRILSVLDRVFFAASSEFTGKPACCVVCARRSGTTATMDVMNKYFTTARMPIVSSTYWNAVHGAVPEDVPQDDEGLQTMRNIGHGMAWMIRSIEAGKAQGNVLTTERGAWTNFIMK